MNAKLQSIWKPIDSVGLYIPGGNAVYPSSLLMSVIPAQIAGVERIVCVTPPTNNFNPYLAFLLDELGIIEVYQVGGAQAVAALAFGTDIIKPVNKIFGPGNAYVASASSCLALQIEIVFIKYSSNPCIFQRFFCISKKSSTETSSGFSSPTSFII